MKRIILFVIAFLFAAILLAQNPTTLVSAKFSYDDGSAVGGTVALFRVGSPEISLGTFPLDTQGRVSASIALDPAAQYHAQLLDSTGVVILEIRSIPISSTIAASAIAVLPTGELDVVIVKAAPQVSTTQITFVPFLTTLDFFNPAPSNPLNGIYKGIDWGTNQWAWESAWSGCPDPNVYFNNSTGASRSFSFVSPSVLANMQVCSLIPGTATLKSNANETFSQSISASTFTTLTTGWTKPATQITVTFTNAWNLGWYLSLDTISYHQ